MMVDVVQIKDLKTAFGRHVVHDHLNLQVKKGEILGIVGGSGSGKSVLLHTLLGLRKPQNGQIHLLGKDMLKVNAKDLKMIKSKIGVLFQDGALFSSLTVGENIAVPIKEHLKLPSDFREEIIQLKLSMVGLAPEVAFKFPSELSGGMKKRAGLARSLALDPEVLFLDEPTAGLDAISAYHFDQLILHLNKSLGLTVVMITHDLDTLFSICDRVAVLIDKHIIVDSIDKVMNLNHPWIKEYFNGERGLKSQQFLTHRQKKA
jgi:phospholipid/cholesterol/gamma-HCH transport system ATP-binding protein